MNLLMTPHEVKAQDQKHIKERTKITLRLALIDSASLFAIKSDGSIFARTRQGKREGTLLVTPAYLLFDSAVTFQAR